MNELTLKQSLEHALKNFSNGTLVENSHHLLQILGYRSQHTVELSPNTFEGLKVIKPWWKIGYQLIFCFN